MEETKLNDVNVPSANILIVQVSDGHKILNPGM